MLEISIDETQLPTATIDLSGSLDSSTAADLEQFFASSVSEEVKVLVMRMQDLNFISSEGLRVLAKIRKTMRSHGGTTYFVNLSRQVQKVFEIVRAAPLNEIFTSTAELDAYLAEMQRKAVDD
ncbi:anti-sigma factor antagonist [Undibacterium sp. KW1]|uniref:STAS domain-containing protein n=1 Tax=Undibacterium sp. KW1 TaxID=2058624 RepID=UPI001331C825|nr:STAS domain-containing protein [Undibacterium sp. KW1]BBB58818.1 anti-sigma factor antagonist [Undibacterium sp. KW1]